MSTVTVRLSKEIVVKGQPTLSLTFRKAKLGDLIAGDSVNGELAKTAAILSAMAGISYPEIKELEVDDLNKIIAEVGSLMGNLPAPAPTGAA